jgi:23S rRNA (cytidine1920-2'-O)/16S rRNA (cytidine1409-2'-O)-methyltransferase
VLLARGAARVYAVDVGHGQLHPKLAGDPRVVSLEGSDIRRLDRTAILEPVGICVADLSFISLKLVIPSLKQLVRKPGYLVALIKPQFEAGRDNVGRGGIVRDKAIRQAVLDDVGRFVAAQGFTVLGTMPSPIEGGTATANSCSVPAMGERVTIAAARRRGRRRRGAEWEGSLRPRPAAGRDRGHLGRAGTR